MNNIIIQNGDKLYKRMRLGKMKDWIYLKDESGCWIPLKKLEGKELQNYLSIEWCLSDEE